MSETHLWRIKFRTNPNECVFTHAVPVTRQEGVPGYTFHPSFCGRELPDHMKADIDAFALFINRPGEVVDCIDCARKAGFTSTVVVRPS